jgi:hypothetical protein
MSFAEKYGIDDGKLKQMIRDGFVGCTVSKYEDVIRVYRESIASGHPKMQAIANAAHAGKIQERQVYNIIKKML